MTALPWVATAVLACIVIWLLFALAGANHTIASLRGVAETDVGPDVLSAGLPAGTRAPGLGSAAAALDGTRHLVVFVDPDCAACDELVPALRRAAVERRVPETVLVSRGDPADVPADWRGGDRLRSIVETDSALSDLYDVDVTPTVFLVDEGGHIVAGGPTATVEDVTRLVETADGVRIAPGSIATGGEVAHGSS